MKFTELFKDNKNVNDPEAYRVYKDSLVRGHNIYNQNEKLTFTDAMNTPNGAVWLPRVMQEVARDAIEPNLVLTPLLQRIPYSPGLQIMYGAMGALTASDIAEGQAYPEQQLQIGGSNVTAVVGKSGVAFKMTEEMRTRSQFNILGMHLQAAGRALARHKERKTANFMTTLGTCVFDNSNPTASLYGTTTGRDATGAANGSITWDDMFDMFGTVIDNGFMPNLIIMHPLAWVMFMKDPVLRSFAIASGGGTWWGSYTGQPAGKAPWDIPKSGETVGQSVTPPNVQGLTPTTLEGMPQVGALTSAPVIPNYFLPYATRIIVSPFMYYDPASRRTDIIVADQMELGALIVEEDLFIDSWDDKSVEIEKVKLREKYGYHIFNEGLAIAVAKNISTDPNEVVLPARAQLDASSLPTINRTTAV